MAYSDPVQLTMRTSLGFGIRAMGLRGAFEIAALKGEADGGDANAKAVIAQLPGVLQLTQEPCDNLLHQIADDPYTKFLLVAYA